MKKKLKILQKTLFTILIAATLPSWAQEITTNQIEKTFLPEDYVKNILITHQRKTSEMFRKQPIEAFLIIKGNQHIKTYGGKVNPTPTRKNPDGEIEFPSVNQLLNLMYFKEDDFKTATFFIKQVDENNLSLEIVDSGRRKTVPFINSINGYQFEDPEVTYTKLLLNGSYVLQDSGKKSTITFDLNGHISDNEYWNKYAVEGVHLYSKHPKAFFKSITLISKSGDEYLNLAFTYHPDIKSWAGYSYKKVTGNVIEIKEGKTVRLIRK